MTFATRQEAGRTLGRYLETRDVRCDLVLALPRGGVLVAAQVAHILAVPLDVLIARKIGHPRQREFAVGALAEPDVVVFDPSVVAAGTEIHHRLKEIIREERERLQHYRAMYHLGPLLDLRGKSVLLVDDGLATGATMEAAVLSARKQQAGRVVVASPVASGDALRRLRRTANEVVALHVDEAFDAVGRYYAVFDQTTDAEVLDALRAGRKQDD